jgi:hypothetical protein
MSNADKHNKSSGPDFCRLQHGHLISTAACSRASTHVVEAFDRSVVRPHRAILLALSHEVAAAADGRCTQSAIAAATCPSTRLEMAPLPPKMRAASIVTRFW